MGVLFSQSARPPHIYISAIILLTRETLITWFSNWSACFMSIDNLCDCVLGQVHPLVMKPSICCVSWWPMMSWSHWARNHSLLCCHCKSTWANSVLATWSTCWLFCCSSVTLGYRHIYLRAVPSQPSCPSGPQYSSPGGFTSALPIILLPLLQPPSQGICHHPWISIEVKYWPYFLFSNVWTQLEGSDCKLTYLVLQQFPCLDVMDFIQFSSTCDAFLQHD